MKYRFEIVKKGLRQKFCLVLFEDAKYDLLTDFFGLDARPSLSALKEQFTRIFKGETQKETFIGDKCILYIFKDKTMVFDKDSKDINSSKVEVDTESLWKILQHYESYLRENRL